MGDAFNEVTWGHVSFSLVGLRVKYASRVNLLLAFTACVRSDHPLSSSWSPRRSHSVHPLLELRLQFRVLSQRQLRRQLPVLNPAPPPVPEPEAGRAPRRAPTRPAPRARHREDRTRRLCRQVWHYQ